MEISELHPMLRHLAVYDVDKTSYEDLVEWLLAVANYLHSESVLGVPAGWNIPRGMQGPQVSEAWRAMAIYDYARAFSLSEVDVENFGQYLWDLRMAMINGIVQDSTNDEEL